MSVVASARTDGGIRMEGLAKTFRGPDGPIHAVRGIDVSIAAGETAALLGPNGAGKSTTIDMLLGLAKLSLTAARSRSSAARRVTRSTTVSSARCCRRAS
jgi:ABC-type glutathione transport system ATPase component